MPIPRPRAPSTIARATGCSLSRSAAATRPRSAASPWPSRSTTSVSSGRPDVRVPVLSRSTVSTRLAASSAAPPLTRTPSSAPAPGPDGHGGRRGQPERARAGDHEHGDEPLDRRREPRGGGVDREPRGERERRDAEHDGHEDAAHHVGEARDRRARALRLLDGLDDARERGVRAGLRDAEGEGAALVERPAEHGRARRLVDGHALAGEHRLVDRGRAVDHLAVGRDALAGPHAHEVARPERGGGHLVLGVAADAPGGLRLERHEPAHRVGEPLPRARLEELAEQHEGDDRGRGLEVDGRRVAVLGVREEAGAATAAVE